MSEQIAEHVWYFARGDQERGPFSEPQIRSLVAAGKLRDDDLVWKEGMPEWILARDAPELMTPAPPAEPPIVHDSATPPEPHFAVSDSAPQDSGRRWAGASPAVPQPVSQQRSLQSQELLRTAGYLVAVVGFLSALTSQGCSSFSHRNATRLEAVAKYKEIQFQREWDDRAADLKREHLLLTQNERMLPADQHRAQQITVQLKQIDQQRQVKLAEMTDNDWRDLRRDAEDARHNADVWGVARQGAFYVGVFLLAAGLLLTSFAGVGPERWISLAILGAIVFSMLMGGESWR